MATLASVKRLEPALRREGLTTNQIGEIVEESQKIGVNPRVTKTLLRQALCRRFGEVKVKAIMDGACGVADKQKPIDSPSGLVTGGNLEIE